MYIVVKVKEREIRRLGMFHRQADAKNFLERDFRKSFLIISGVNLPGRYQQWTWRNRK